MAHSEPAKTATKPAEDTSGLLRTDDDSVGAVNSRRSVSSMNWPVGIEV